MMTTEERAKLEKMISDWEASGATKTSAYWRLLSMLRKDIQAKAKPDETSTAHPRRPRSA